MTSGDSDSGLKDGFRNSSHLSLIMKTFIMTTILCADVIMKIMIIAIVPLLSIVFLYLHPF